MARPESGMDIVLRTGGSFCGSDGPYFPFHNQTTKMTEPIRTKVVTGKTPEYITPHARPSDALFAKRAELLRQPTHHGGKA